MKDDADGTVIKQVIKEDVENASSTHEKYSTTLRQGHADFILYIRQFE